MLALILNPNLTPNPTCTMRLSLFTEETVGWTTERTPLPFGYVFSASECREAYGVRAACCRFRTFLKFPSSLDWRKRQQAEQAARTPYASRHSDALNTYPFGRGEADPSLVGGRSACPGPSSKVASKNDHRWIFVPIQCVLALLLAVPVSAQTLTVLHSFSPTS